MLTDKVTLDAGGGGRASQRLIDGLFLKYFSNAILAHMDDAALLNVSSAIAMSTDSYTIDPVEFPGGNIGSLAVHGTVNDVAMMGARPEYLSCAFILEEGLPMPLLERIVAAMATAAADAEVKIVTGDTKVVPRGAADKIFINTTGIGRVISRNPPRGKNARPGHAVLISGSMGDHGLTVLAQRESLQLSSALESDSAPLNHMAEALVTNVRSISVLRDPTRGGLATTLNEIAGQSGVSCEIDETLVPVKAAVRDGCAILGLDPLYLANEGKLICIVPDEDAKSALDVMRHFTEGRDCARIGEIVEAGPAGAQVVLRTPLGGKRLLGMLEGAQLPRIC